MAFFQLRDILADVYQSIVPKRTIKNQFFYNHSIILWSLSLPDILYSNIEHSDTQDK